MDHKNIGTTSARVRAPKQGPEYNPAVIAIIVVCVIVVLVIALKGGDDEVPPSPTPQPEPQAAASTTVKSTPAPSIPGSSSLEIDFGTPTPTPPPTPSITPEACVSFKWTANFRSDTEQPLPIIVTLQNSCLMDVDSLNMTFEARAFQSGEMTASSRATFSGSLTKGQSTELHITVPGTVGGVDRLDVQPVSDL